MMPSEIVELFLEMQRDIADVRQRLVEQGIADKDRMCVLGWGYSGFVALMGAVDPQTPYRCVVDLAGVPDLDLLMRDVRRGIGSEVFDTRLGGGRRDLKKLDAISPLESVKQVRVPILIVHNDQEQGVDIKHSEKLAKALERKKRTYEFLRIEGAESTIQEKRTLRYRTIESFLAEHL